MPGVSIIQGVRRVRFLLFQNGHRIGVECKRADAPTLTPSMRIAMADLKLADWERSRNLEPLEKIGPLP